MTDFSNRKSRMSAVDAIAPAFNHMVKVLFRPFKLSKWLKFGLVALVITCGFSQSGGGGNFNIPDLDDFKKHKVEEYFSQSTESSKLTTSNLSTLLTKPPESEFSKFVGEFKAEFPWVVNNLVLVIVLGVLIILIVSIIILILYYFSSRFTFIYLDGVIKNDVQIKRAYKENRINAWSYFLWRILFTPHAVLFILLLTGVPAGIIIYNCAKTEFTAGSIILLILLGLVLVGLFILLGIIGRLTTDFVVPIMYLLKIRILKAWGVLFKLMKHNKGQFTLYILITIGFGLAAAAVLIVPCCVLGCVTLPFYIIIAGLGFLALKYPLIWIAVIPLSLIIWIVGGILWETVISPITIFFRTYPLVFLEGFGDEFANISLLRDPPHTEGRR